MPSLLCTICILSIACYASSPQTHDWQQPFYILNPHKFPKSQIFKTEFIVKLSEIQPRETYSSITVRLDPVKSAEYGDSEVVMAQTNPVFYLGYGRVWTTFADKREMDSSMAYIPHVYRQRSDDGFIFNEISVSSIAEALNLLVNRLGLITAPDKANILLFATRCGSFKNTVNNYSAKNASTIISSEPTERINLISPSFAYDLMIPVVLCIQIPQLCVDSSFEPVSGDNDQLDYRSETLTIINKSDGTPEVVNSLDISKFQGFVVLRFISNGSLPISSILYKGAVVSQSPSLRGSVGLVKSHRSRSVTTKYTLDIGAYRDVFGLNGSTELVAKPVCLHKHLYYKFLPEFTTGSIIIVTDKGKNFRSSKKTFFFVGKGSIWDPFRCCSIFISTEFETATNDPRELQTGRVYLTIESREVSSVESTPSPTNALGERVLDPPTVTQRFSISDQYVL